MSERSAPRGYGVSVGLVAALFAAVQPLLSYAAARGSEGSVRAIQRVLNIIATGGVADPTLLLPNLIPMFVVTYGSMLLIGCATVWLAWYAARLTAMSAGRNDVGAGEALWVWLISSLVWFAVSIAVVAITHMDGTVSGVFSGTGTPEFFAQQVTFLLLQEITAALICLGACAFAGLHGARKAPIIEPEPALPVGAPVPFAPYPFVPQGSPGFGYPPAGYPGHMPPAMHYPGQYPPPPTYYAPQPVPQQAPPPQLTPQPAPQPAPQVEAQPPETGAGAQ